MASHSSTTERCLNAIIGTVLLICAALAVSDIADLDGMQWLVVIVLTALGADALQAAWKSRGSLLSRLGPLP